MNKQQLEYWYDVYVSYATPDEQLMDFEEFVEHVRGEQDDADGEKACDPYA